MAVRSHEEPLLSVEMLAGRRDALQVRGRAAWGEVEAAVVDTSPGRFAVEPRSTLRLVMHLGAPARTRCTVDATGEDRRMEAGDFDLIPPRHPAAWDDRDPTTTLNLSLSMGLLGDAAANLGVRRDRLSFRPQLQGRDPVLRQLAMVMRSALFAPEPPEPLFIGSVAQALALRIVGEHGRRTAATPRPSPAYVVRRTLEYIDAHLAEPLTVERLAREAGLGASQLQARFRRETGLTVHRLVLERRVERAVRLIDEGATVTAAAASAGFAHRSHLARAVRRSRGVSPRGLHAGSG